MWYHCVKYWKKYSDSEVWWDMFLCVTIATSTSLFEWCINVNVVYKHLPFVHVHPYNSSIRSFVRSFIRMLTAHSCGSSNHVQILRVVHGESFVHTSNQQITQPPYHVMRSVQTIRSAALSCSPVSWPVTIHLDCWAREMHYYKIAVRRITIDSGFRWFFFDFFRFFQKFWFKNFLNLFIVSAILFSAFKTCC